MPRPSCGHAGIVAGETNAAIAILEISPSIRAFSFPAILNRSKKSLFGSGVARSVLSGNPSIPYILVTYHSSLITLHSSLFTHHSSLFTHHSSLITLIFLSLPHHHK